MREDLDIPMPSMGPSYRVSRRREVMDPNTKRLAIIAGGIGGTLLLLVGGWSLTGRHHGGVPVVEANSRPLKVKPENPGGLQVAGQDESILSGNSTSNSQATLAPAPEVPALSALKAQEQQQQQVAAAPSPAMTAQPVSLNTAPPADTSQSFSSPPIPAAPRTAVATRQEAPVASRPGLRRRRPGPWKPGPFLPNQSRWPKRRRSRHLVAIRRCSLLPCRPSRRR